VAGAKLDEKLSFNKVFASRTQKIHIDHGPSRWFIMRSKTGAVVRADGSQGFCEWIAASFNEIGMCPSHPSDLTSVDSSNGELVETFER
ncbi:MAG: hypothetical protein O3A29_16420, partial [Planctomycetota bacterium]|nr:hypothetical protein [Planctomycetota bacterium]